PKPRLSIASNNLFRWLLWLARPDGASVSGERFYKAALLLARPGSWRRLRRFGPEQIALPLGHPVDSRQLALPSIGTDVPLPGVITLVGCLTGLPPLLRPLKGSGVCRLADIEYELERPFCKAAESTAPAIRPQADLIEEAHPSPSSLH